ncbi:DUF6265 family protein [Pedobacter gandavensis]|uniref:DUF6265 family protein n=1 Tax=Pedobacter gandavensis TaxID=2679963 RepID=UPI0029302824|nr:DUF6265 family protein [Pedobacter gandavensis]
MSKFKTLFIIFAFLFIHIANGQESKIQNLEWITGKWLRTNAKSGQSGYEIWTKSSDSKLSGKGVTLKGKEILFIENMEFQFKGKELYFVVSVTGEKEATFFKITELIPNGFTCENPQHDFPKKISYKRNGKYLKAVISGDGQSVDYNFIKEN